MASRITRALLVSALLAIATTASAGGSVDAPPAEPACVESGVTTGVTAEGVRYGISAISCEPAG